MDAGPRAKCITGPLVKCIVGPKVNCIVGPPVGCIVDPRIKCILGPRAKITKIPGNIGLTIRRVTNFFLRPSFVRGYLAAGPKAKTRIWPCTSQQPGVAIAQWLARSPADPVAMCLNP